MNEIRTHFYSFGQLEKSKKKILLLFSSCLLIFLLARVNYQQVSSFSFVDEFNNYMAAYFMLHGRHLYSQIFFNHQMIMPYISYTIQFFLHPQSLYKLIFYHRMSIFLFSIAMDILITLRYNISGFFFAFFFELTKFYLFGNLFLAEAIVVYLLVYLFLLSLEKLRGNGLSFKDYILSALFTWLTVFLREPLIPVALFLYAVILWDKKISKGQLLSIGIFTACSLLIISTVPLKDYIYELTKVNATTIVSSEAKTNNILGLGILRVVFYPLVILSEGKVNYFKNILLTFDIIFLAFLTFFLRKREMIKEVTFIVLVLGLANIRFVPPGSIFYSAFHMLPWYGLFLATNAIVIKSVYIQNNIKMKKILFAVLTSLSVYILFSPGSFIWQKISIQEQFTTNYASYYVNGEIVNTLARKSDTLFIDGYDSLVFWQSKRGSSYKYTFFYPVMATIPLYREERRRMFAYNPPMFYYTNCPKDSHDSPYLSFDVARNYTQLKHNGVRTCLYIHKRKISSISSERWSQIKQLGFYL